MSSRLLLICVLLASVALCACGTTTRSGRAGDAFSGGGIKVTLERFDLHPPIPSDDVTGLSSPAPGDRLLAARVRVCGRYGEAIGQYDFSLALAGGGEGQPKFPQMNYPDGLDVVRDGCAAGWVVFEYPASSTPGAVRFSYDDSGQSNAGDSNVRSESHERFSWAVS